MRHWGIEYEPDGNLPPNIERWLQWDIDRYPKTWIALIILVVLTISAFMLLLAIGVLYFALHYTLLSDTSLRKFSWALLGMIISLWITFRCRYSYWDTNIKDKM